jgi:hypothetical protein
LTAARLAISPRTTGANEEDRMRKLVMQMELTLDGFMTGPQGEMDWFALDPELWKFKVERFHQVDTVLLGRKNYQGFGGYWPSVATRPTWRSRAGWMTCRR